MYKSLRRQRWTCPNCLVSKRQRRSLTGVAAAARQTDTTDLPPPNYANPAAKHDDSTLRKIFDSRDFWADFSRSSKHHVSGRSAGLFQNRYLTSPEGFQRFAEVTLKKCHKVVAKIIAAHTVEDYKVIVRDLDRLSDLLCRVIDLADFVRNTHPDRVIQSAATQAYSSMFEYMNELNTTIELNEQLIKAASMPEVTNAWSEEEKVVANILMKDFSKSAIDLPESTRRRFVELSSEISVVGSSFADGMAPKQNILTFESSRLKGMNPVVVKKMTRWGQVTIPTTGSRALMALREVEDPDVRRDIYMANRTSSESSTRDLESLVALRSELAKVSGYETFAHMALSDKMAKTPEAVTQFLSALHQANGPRVQSELASLLELKKADAHSRLLPDRLDAWDRDYYTTRLLSGLRTRIRSQDSLRAFFSLGTVMQGLSRLFNRLYGIRLVPRETSPGETWNSDVRRIDVIDDKLGHIAVVYCDLFERHGKSPNPAHFTLRCSRQITTDELQDTASESLSPFDNPVEAATDGMAHTVDPSNGRIYSLPTIALICDFASSSPSSSSQQPTLLSFNEVRTLFHEMGHAVHSILGRTTLQNVAGTRCATDFAELPSVLMEYFAAAPEVLELWARHWETDKPLPYALVKERLDIEKRFAGAEVESQILLALLDQRYHGHFATGESIDSTRLCHETYNSYSSVPEPAGTSPQGFFGHLFGYGATYYSYLFDRAIAAKVWKDVFESGKAATERERGERWREEVLKWGGGRDPWRCVAGVLGGEEAEKVAEGGTRGMERVGMWGVRGD
ncbi:mitochondrial intermediate peptidase [Aulographum hederae CBS 113979]|uniref:Mitochondrial intermediate peptidase n=1 Tax=Aulographum hederae CBS 113979 TaxID=1176131 RepID=A0A6G1GTT1_9PEZI|nr:mitochondrial intermediate peptidase [Aulographum hederae CBS 113979]